MIDRRREECRTARVEQAVGAFATEPIAQRSG